MGFQCIIKLTLPFKTMFLTVIPKRYYCQKQCFSTICQNGISFETNVFTIIFSELVFNVLWNWRCLSKHCFWQKYQNGITIRALFFKEIPKWYYILSYCFQCNIFKIVFRCIFKLTSVCQNSVSDSNTKTVLLSEAVFFKKYSNGSTFKSNVFKVIFSKFFSRVILRWRCLSKHCFWQ